MLVYCPEINNRVRYIWQDIAEIYWGFKPEITHDQEFFAQYSKEKLCYSPVPLKNFENIWIEAHYLLFEKEVYPLTPIVEIYQSIPCFFKSSVTSVLPFDWFASAFYTLTRYEEIVYSKNRDEHNRYIASKSLGYIHGFLSIPVVDYWFLKTREILEKLYPNLPFKKNSGTINLSIDVDSFFAYKGKSSVINVGIFIKNLVRLKFSSCKEQFKSLLNLQTDPYDHVHIWKNIIQKNNIKAYFFIHCGKRSSFDPGFYPSKKIKKYIHQIQSFATIGIHPSYIAHKHKNITLFEKKTLEKFSENKIIHSRQHFILLQFPETYQTLTECEIKHDYTMGYPNEIGFRAGTGKSFPYFNLNQNNQTDLIIHPFQITDIALFMQNESENLLKAQNAIKEALKTGSDIFLLCHSNILTDRKKIPHYFMVMEKLISLYSAS